MNLKHYKTLDEATQATIQEAQTALSETLGRMSGGDERQHYTAYDRRQVKQKLADARAIEAEVCHRVRAYPALFAVLKALRDKAGKLTKSTSAKKGKTQEELDADNAHKMGF